MGHWSPRGTIGIQALVLSALLVSGVLMSACGSPSGDMGSIEGRLSISGGPAPGTDKPTSGNVKAIDKRGATTSTAANGKGQYMLHIEVGTYSLSGTSPNFDGGKIKCHALSKVTVSKDRTTTANTYCPEK
jgi:hypothetical protein